MRECPNAEMRDLLPDVVHGQLGDARRAEVEAHVAGCEACRDELALLRRVRSAMPAPAVDTAAIARALPAYQVQRPNRLAPMLRIAAGLVLMAGAASLVMRDGSRDPAGIDTLAQAGASTAPVLSIGENFHDLSDSDLEALTDELQALDAVMSEEPEEIVVPLTGGTS
jgi:anti-sigma factor RsiW